MLLLHCLLARLSSACLSFMHTRNKTPADPRQSIYPGAVLLATLALCLTFFVTPFPPSSFLLPSSYSPRLLGSLEVPLYAHYLRLLRLLASASVCLYHLASAISKVSLRPLITSNPVLLSCGEVTILGQKESSQVLLPNVQSPSDQSMAQHQYFAFIPQPSNRRRYEEWFESSISPSNSFSITELNTKFLQHKQRIFSSTPSCHPRGHQSGTGILISHSC
jgi:hypothetical protein